MPIYLVTYDIADGDAAVSEAVTGWLEKKKAYRIQLSVWLLDIQANVNPIRNTLLKLMRKDVDRLWVSQVLAQQYAFDNLFPFSLGTSKKTAEEWLAAHPPSTRPTVVQPAPVLKKTTR